jgi:hypothetical protein
MCAFILLFLFNEVICKVGPVEQIMSDRGANFESNVFVHLCKLIGSKKVRSSAFHPSGNGGIEIVNKTIKPNLAKYVSKSHDDWDICLGLAVNSYNNTIQSSIGMAPSEALFNRPPVLMADVICNNRLSRDTNIDNVSDYTLNLWRSAQRVREEVSFNKGVAQGKQKEMYDRFIKNSRTFNVGDLVKIKSFKKTLGVCSAFVERFSGPLKIVKKFSELTFQLVGANGKVETVHYNRLAPFYSRSEVDNESVNVTNMVEPVDNDANVFHSNLDNLTFVVLNYKAKLRRRAARALLAEMGSASELPALENLSLVNDVSNVNSLNGGAVVVPLEQEELSETFGSASSFNGELENIAVAGADEARVENSLLENVRRVGQLEWDELVKLAAEVRFNAKGKRLALCWQCQNWYEASQGMNVHKRSCQCLMPLLVHLSMDGDSTPNLNVAQEEEIRSVFKLEQEHFAYVPIYSDVSEVSDLESIFDENDTKINGTELFDQSIPLGRFHQGNLSLPSPSNFVD